MSTPLPFSVSSEMMRKIEWWALLNCYTRPSDLLAGVDEGRLFAELTREIPNNLRVEFWNGAFAGGRKRRLFV